MLSEPDAAHEAALPAIACEVKLARGLPAGEDEARAALRELAASALDAQALPKRYAHGLVGAGAVLWGVALDASKRAAVACARP